MKVSTYNSTRRDKNPFNFKKEPKKATFTILGIILMIFGIFIIVPILLPLLKLVFGAIIITISYFIIKKNSNLFDF